MLGRLSFPLLLPLFIFFGSVAFGAGGSIPKFNPKGVNGHVGAGFSYFTVAAPATEFRLDPGIAANIGGEKGFGFMNLFLTFGLGYLSSEGTAHYRHVTLSGATTYDATDARFKHDLFNISLGLKFRLIDGFFFRPYVEGGGSFGYSTLKFNFTNVQKSAFSDQNYKDSDSLFAFGKYAEGGAEIAFSDTFGIFVAGRMEWIETKEFEVLYSQATGEKQKLVFSDLTYFVGLLKAF
jgi:hypothetical protein